MKKLMRVVSTITALTLLGLAMVGCASAPQAAPAAAVAQNEPPWINEVPPEDLLWGIGVSTNSSLSLRRSTAEHNAIVEIARQIDSRVKAMFTNYEREAGSGDNQARLSLQEDVSRRLTDVNLSGVQPDVSWTTPDGKTLYRRFSYPKANVLKTVSEVFDNEASRYAEFKADQALAIMNNELERSEAPQVVR